MSMCLTDWGRSISAANAVTDQKRTANSVSNTTATRRGNAAGPTRWFRSAPNEYLPLPAAVIAQLVTQIGANGTRHAEAGDNSLVRGLPPNHSGAKISEGGVGRVLAKLMVLALME